MRLESYAVSRTKRLIKTPKLYWSDPGLGLRLSGNAEPTGFHLEDLVLLDLLAWRHAQVLRPEILYWRTTTDLEVDFVIEHSRGLIAVEVKAGQQPGLSDSRGLKALRYEFSDRFLGAASACWRREDSGCALASSNLTALMRFGTRNAPPLRSIRSSTRSCRPSSSSGFRTRFARIDRRIIRPIR
ncbi:MAG: DUF4143 domain-containing protein [Gammaproteobacteria bacterium]|nr:DUF4143 domain-containing protein [Gammaproteobacteria bacterium]